MLISISIQAQLPKLRISDNNRFLVKEGGSPFVWVGETNWFFAKLPPKTIDAILEKRKQQGFTMMQISCRENLYEGEGPGNIDTPNEAWWSYLDEYISKCRKKGLYVGITLGWWGKAKRYTEAELYTYGKWVGERYRNDDNIVWLTLGEAGSHKRKQTISEEKLASLVRGIRDGDTGNKLLTIHADYQRGTSLTNDASLCDFNNWQTGQWDAPDGLPRKGEKIASGTVWDAIQYDYGQLYHKKPKPTIDLEAKYERNKDFCGATPFVIRRRAYFTIFAGAFGHTYGAGGIWDGLNEPNGCSESALEALNYEGAIQIGYVSRFLHRLGDAFLKLRPIQSIISSANSPDYDYHIQATVSSDKSFSLIYSASDNEYSLDLSKLLEDDLLSVWYNPRKDTYHGPSHFNKKEFSSSIKKFDPPGNLGKGNDWVLLLGNKGTIETFIETELFE